MGLVFDVEIGWIDVVVATALAGLICRICVIGGWAIADTLGEALAWTVIGWVEELLQRQDESERVINGWDAAAMGATEMTGDPAVAVTIGYGVVVVRAWPAILGFGTFGVQTAHGSSPTKRSPIGLAASGCAWEVIFNAMKIPGENWSLVLPLQSTVW